MIVSGINLGLFHHQVFFCTSVPATTKQMTFRPPRGDDYFGSYLRRHVFLHLPQRELAFDVILGRANEDYDPEDKMILTDDDNPLPKWQDEGAPDHWKCEFIDLIFPRKSHRPGRVVPPNPVRFKR